MVGRNNFLTCLPRCMFMDQPGMVTPPDRVWGPIFSGMWQAVRTSRVNPANWAWHRLNPAGTWADPRTWNCCRRGGAYDQLLDDTELGYGTGNTYDPTGMGGVGGSDLVFH
jgi:hypothetical protein